MDFKSLMERLAVELKDIDLSLDYSALSSKYQPPIVKLLIVGNAPPKSRYFYKEDVSQYDGLFLAVCEAMNPDDTLLYQMNKTEVKKRKLLEEFKQKGGFIMDVYPKPEEDCKKEGELSYWLDDFKKRFSEIPMEKNAHVILCHKNAHKLSSFFQDRGFRTMKVNCPVQHSDTMTSEHKGTFVRKLSKIFQEMEDSNEPSDN